MADPALGHSEQPELVAQLAGHPQPCEHCADAQGRPSRQPASNSPAQLGYALRGCRALRCRRAPAGRRAWHPRSAAGSPTYYRAKGYAGTPALPQFWRPRRLLACYARTLSPRPGLWVRAQGPGPTLAASGALGRKAGPCRATASPFGAQSSRPQVPAIGRGSQRILASKGFGNAWRVLWVPPGTAPPPAGHPEGML